MIINNLRGKSKVKNHQGSVTVTRRSHEPKLDGATPPLGMKIVLVVLVSLFMLSLVNALYAGEDYTFTLDTTDVLTWDVVDNSSSMEGFSVEQEIKDTYSIITFIIPLNYKPDNFTIILTSNKTNEVIREIHSGGGGSSRIIYRNNTIEKNNTVYVDKEIIVTKEVPVNVNVDSEPIIPSEEKSHFWINILTIILAVFIGWCINVLGKKRAEVIYENKTQVQES